MSKSVSKKFRATLLRQDSRLKWVVIRIPFDVATIWGKRGQLRVRGEVNGLAFRTSLFPTGNGTHIMIVNKRMQKGANVTAGGTAEFRLEPDSEPRTVAMPKEFERALREDRSLRRWYEALNYSTRNEIAKWISEPKQAESRTRRAEQMAERLLATMEAERELPPVIKNAFAENAHARQGWERMSGAQRRGELMGIFYYRNPESRARRIQKTLEAAALRAGRQAG